MVAQILRNAKDEKPDDSRLPDFESLQSKVNDACIYQYSYSSLASKKRVLENREDFYDNGEISVDGNRANREDFIEAGSGTNSILIDDASALVQPCANYDKNAPVAGVANYPRGANLGDALHKVFENLDFETVGNLPDENAAREDATLRNLIAETYQGNSIHIQEHPEWNDLTAGFIWNTMNAELPEIHGSIATGKTFRLKDLPAATRRAEMGFHLDSHGEESSWMNCLCKGFIDLMFVRKGDDGEDYYSILDWKSDVMDDADYSDKDALSQKIEEEYSIQRVLYSYLLIKWLKQFYGEDEPQIFEKHFGGIYYALARGTNAGTCNGIYCQTWKSYSDLEKSYRNVAALMKRSTKESA
jgi:exodeoxyribonuclease V beta subunit